MSIYSPFVPTYLYIKQHSITCKLYFGKTTRNDPENYPGSGKHWKRHIKKHGKHITTLWYERFDNVFDLVAFALSFSEKLNIVESTQWLNLKPETGLDGGGTGLSEESILKSKETKIKNKSQHKTTGMATAKFKDGSKLGHVSVNDPRWETGEIVGILTGAPSKRKIIKEPKQRKQRIPWNKGKSIQNDARIKSTKNTEYNKSRTKCSCVICKKEVDVANFVRHHSH